jgi:hypothetical protein
VTGSDVFVFRLNLDLLVRVTIHKHGAFIIWVDYIDLCNWCQFVNQHFFVRLLEVLHAVFVYICIHLLNAAQFNVPVSPQVSLNYSV